MIDITIISGANLLIVSVLEVLTVVRNMYPNALNIADRLYTFTLQPNPLIFFYKVVICFPK